MCSRLAVLIPKGAVAIRLHLESLMAWPAPEAAPIGLLLNMGIFTILNRITIIHKIMVVADVGHVAPLPRAAPKRPVWTDVAYQTTILVWPVVSLV